MSLFVLASQLFVGLVGCPNRCIPAVLFAVLPPHPKHPNLVGWWLFVRSLCLFLLLSHWCLLVLFGSPGLHYPTIPTMGSLCLFVAVCLLLFVCLLVVVRCLVVGCCLVFVCLSRLSQPNIPVCVDSWLVVVGWLVFLLGGCVFGYPGYPNSNIPTTTTTSQCCLFVPIPPTSQPMSRCCCYLFGLVCPLLSVWCWLVLFGFPGYPTQHPNDEQSLFVCCCLFGGGCCLVCVCWSVVVWCLFGYPGYPNPTSQPMGSLCLVLVVVWCLFVGWLLFGVCLLLCSCCSL